MAVANCPACGGPIEFTIGSSIVVVCDHCRSVVARTDRALEDLGKVAALVDTGSPLRRDLPGKFHGTGFRLTGRTQMEHEAGGLWDEWYAAFDDGRWGWIAEAQGKFYLTFATGAKDLPSAEQIEVGGTLGDLVVTEIGSARVVGGEGEIPWRVVPGTSYDYADLSGPSGKFATIDYSEEQPLLFTGTETNLAGLGIAIDPSLTAPGAGEAQMRKPRVSVEKLSCSNCGGPLTLVAPDNSERIICPNCGGVHDVDQGNLKFLQVLKLHGPKPAIALASKGTIDGVEYVVAGFMRRSVTFDVKYEWSEYLLFAPGQGFRWLVESDDHWSFAWPISAGDVVDGTRGTEGVAKTLVFGNEAYKIFQVAMAKVESVVGEFYWKVAVGETVRTFDYINPPKGISKEITSSLTEPQKKGSKKSIEVNYSASRYMKPVEVEKAFGISGLRRPSGVGMQQPYGGKSVFPLWLKLIGALIAISLVLAVRGMHADALEQSFDFSVATDSSGAPVADTSASTSGSASATRTDWTSGTNTTSTVTSTDTSASTTSAAPPKPETSRVVFTKPFSLQGNRHVKIEGLASVENSWVYVSGDLVNEQTGMVEAFELPIEYYHGVDDGESWSEGGRSVQTVLSAVPAGSYVMRLEGQWADNTTPPPVHIRVREGGFLWSHFLLAFFAITIPAGLAGYRRLAFENARWEEASYTVLGTER